MYAEAQYVSGEWFNHAANSDMKNTIWRYSKDLRAGMPLTLKRVQNYVDNEDPRLSKITGYQTVLECCGKEMPIAHVHSESTAEFLLTGWVRELDKILSKYELGQHAMKPASIKTPDEFIRAILTSETYKEKHIEDIDQAK